ncbi:hypothetical protein K466DRAFT_477410 [Polyporus arcularius HHB13444]|uniref:Uncharacterized protein n=1 Tax=Polyporus arcularius HHB13444 TaxID=1314778 RepID=A0A5C3PX15_9APHY|nr:hypothetical protein K466DRAFT_477410 [Polyporus arcularius HHB13444]
MGKLRDFLSSQPNPRPMTVREIRHRYQFWKTHHVLHKMTSLELSSLIRLLGTLSISEYGHPQTSLYTHPRASQMPESTFVPHWTFLKQVGKDKRWLRHPLLPSDHYWLLRAYLALFWEQVQTDSSSAEQMLTIAGKHYLALCTTTSYPDGHTLYFDALAASPSSGPMQAFVTSLLKALRERRHRDDGVVDAFFHLVLRCDQQISGSLKEELLGVVSGRVASANNTRVASDGGDPEASGTGALAAALESTLFPLGRASGDGPISQWSVSLANKLFPPTPAVKGHPDVRWNCIMLLALARTRSTDGGGQVVPTIVDPVQHAAVVEWRTVCVLAAIENLFRSDESHGAPFADDVVQGFSHVIRRLWKEWASVSPSVGPPIPVARIICASFLRLGGQLKDKALVEVCRDFCVVEGLWSVRATQPGTEAGLQLMAAEQLYASLVCGTFFERALVDLMVYTNHMRILRGAVDTAIVRFSKVDPEHAQEVVAWANSRAILPTDTVVADVGVALAKRGISGFLDRYLDDTRLAPGLRAKVASAHLRMYMRYGRRFVNPTETMEKVETFFVLAAQLERPNSFLVTLRSVLFVLIRHQHAPKVVKMVEDLSTQHPTWFSDLFYTRLLRTLLDHRQFRLAQRTLSLCLSKHSKDAERWTSLVLFRLYRARAKTLVTKLLRQPRASRAALLALERTRTRKSVPMKAAHRTPSNVWTEDPHAWRKTVNSLVRKGGFRHAKQFFDAVHARASPGTRTSIGNVILHGYLLRRTSSNRRRLQMVVDTYRQFKEQYAFAPDHVTVNILLKAQLRSTQDVNAHMARQLFDVLVRRGYPTGAGLSTAGGGKVDPPPFGMDASPVETVIVGQLEVPKVDAPLLYKRHVEPLYKMFVKAFYQRGDVVAARKVLGIIKTLQAQEWRSNGRS